MNRAEGDHDQTSRMAFAINLSDPPEFWPGSMGDPIQDQIAAVGGYPRIISSLITDAGGMLTITRSPFTDAASVAGFTASG